MYLNIKDHRSRDLGSQVSVSKRRWTSVSSAWRELCHIIGLFWTKAVSARALVSSDTSHRAHDCRCWRFIDGGLGEIENTTFLRHQRQRSSGQQHGSAFSCAESVSDGRPTSESQCEILLPSVLRTITTVARCFEGEGNFCALLHSSGFAKSPPSPKYLGCPSRATMRPHGERLSRIALYRSISTTAW